MYCDKKIKYIDELVQDFKDNEGTAWTIAEVKLLRRRLEGFNIEELELLHSQIKKGS